MRPAGAGSLDLRVAPKVFRARGAPVEVLRDVSLRLAPGEVVALTGPSGCGKTTLLRIAAGLDADFEGERRLENVARLAVVFQEPRLLPWRTVEQNVRLALPDDQVGKPLDALFETLGLSAHRALFPGELSLGLARRAAIARAFAIEPDMLMLDEPFVSLDAAMAARLRGELATLTRGAGVTTLIVTHDLAEAAELADRIVTLSARPGRIASEQVVRTP